MVCGIPGFEMSSLHLELSKGKFCALNELQCTKTRNGAPPSLWVPSNTGYSMNPDVFESESHGWIITC